MKHQAEGGCIADGKWYSATGNLGASAYIGEEGYGQNRSPSTLLTLLKNIVPACGYNHPPLEKL